MDKSTSASMPQPLCVTSFATISYNPTKKRLQKYEISSTVFTNTIEAHLSAERVEDDERAGVQ